MSNRIAHTILGIVGLTACFLALLLCCPGCATSGSGSTGGTNAAGSKIITPERVQAITKLAVYAGTIADLASHPEHRPALERARAGLDALVAQEKWDSAAMAIAFSESGQNFSGPEGSLILTGAPLLLDAFTGGKFDLGKPELIRAAITGAEQGLTLALGPRPRGRDAPDPWLEKLTIAAEATRPVR